ncbi:MAG: FAD/NAD(P)-binding protein [Candidatus Berkiellales bacterium]
MINPLIPQPYLIDSIQPESPDTFTLTLSAINHQPKQFLPGQFNMLYAFGVGEAAISISSNPEQQQKLAHTIRNVGSVTRNLQKLTAGNTIFVRGPFGTAWPIDGYQGKSLLLLAGGIGIAPLRSLIYLLLAHRQNFAEITLIYGARTPQDLIYTQEFSRWKKNIQLLVTVDHALKPWTGHVGVITPFISKSIKDPDNTVVMMCGPEIMMRFAYYALREENIKPEHIYLSMERNMQCGVGHCGHCQWGPFFICKDGPVMNFKHIEPFFFIKEL